LDEGFLNGSPGHGRSGVACTPLEKGNDWPAKTGVVKRKQSIPSWLDRFDAVDATQKEASQGKGKEAVLF
jgi:hypothetical protein